MRSKLWIGVGAFVTTQAGMVALPAVAHAADVGAVQPGEGEHEGRFEHGEGEHEGHYRPSPRARAYHHRVRDARYRDHRVGAYHGEHGEHEGGEHEHGD